MSEFKLRQYPLGPDGNYGSAECLLAQKLMFQNALGGEGIPKTFAPHLKIVKNETTKCTELSIILFSPSNYVLDANSAIVCDYMGTELLVFINLCEEGEADGTLQCFDFKVCFSSAFSKRLVKKNIFVIPVHGDPEEGEASKTADEGEEEID